MPRNFFISIFCGLLIFSCQKTKPFVSSFKRATNNVITGYSTSSPSASWADIDEDGDDDLLVLNGFATLEEDRTPQKDLLYENLGNGKC